MTFTAGQILTAAQLEAAVARIDQVVDGAGTGTTVSTSYTATLTGATALSTTFTAARSSHWVGVSAVTLNSGGGGPFGQFMSFTVTGAGFTTYGPVDVDAAESQWTNNNTGGRVTARTLVSGLTPGVTYTVSTVYRVTGSTATFRARRLTIE